MRGWSLACCAAFAKSVAIEAPSRLAWYRRSRRPSRATAPLAVISSRFTLTKPMLVLMLYVHAAIRYLHVRTILLDHLIPGFTQLLGFAVTSLTQLTMMYNLLLRHRINGVNTYLREALGRIHLLYWLRRFRHLPKWLIPPSELELSGWNQ